MRQGLRTPRSSDQGLGPSPQASESPFLSPPCPQPSCCHVPLSRLHKESHGEREWAVAPSPDRGLCWSLFGSSGEERKIAAGTKAVAIPLCPTKRSGLGRPGPCGQPLGAVPEAEEALFFPHGSCPSPTEFPFPSS